MRVFIDPISDIFIKYLLSLEENKDVLLSFINSVQQDSGFTKIVDVEVKNPFNIKNFAFDKESILDIKATDEDGRLYDIEVQTTGNEEFRLRSLYYWAKLYWSQLKEGESYKVLKPVICINLLGFPMFKTISSLHNCFILCENKDRSKVLTDHLMIHFIEISKFKNILDKNPLNRWLYYFTHEGKKEEEMETLIKDDEVFNKAHKAYKRFTEDEELRDLYESRQKWQRDYNSGIEAAEEEGIKKGKKEGKLEDAVKMLKENLPIDLISRVTGLSIKEIESLK